MVEKTRKIVGVLIVLAGIVELFMAVSEGGISAVLIGICLLIFGGLYFIRKKK